MRSEITIISPEVAKYFLTMSKKNRTIHWPTVNKYADEMKRGQWKLTGQSITIDRDGKLHDGYHRCNAIIKSGITIVNLVVFDVDPDSFDVYDIGKPRSMGDILSIAEVKNSTIIGGAILTFQSLKNNVTANNKGYITMKLSRTDVLNIYNDNAELWDEIVKVSLVCNTAIKALSPNKLAGFMAYLILEEKKPKPKVFSFIKQVYDKEPNQFICTKSLRDKLIKEFGKREKISSDDKVKLFKNTYRYFEAGKNAKRIKFD